MGKIISVNSQKGGCGKTTTVQSLAGSLSKKGFKCLVVDLVPQGDLTFSSDIQNAENSVYEFLMGSCSFDDAVQKNKYYDILPGNKCMIKADQELTETTLRDALNPIRERYDFIILDTPSSYGVVSTSSLVAADYMIAPVDLSFYAFQGLEQLYETFETVKGQYNINLKFLGFLLVKYNSKSKINRIISFLIERSAKNMEYKVFESKIRECINIIEMQGLQMNIFDLPSSSGACIDYKMFTDEILTDIQDLKMKKVIG